MDKTDGVLIKLDPSKKHIFIIDPTSPLVDCIEWIKKLDDGMILFINPQDIKIIETENEIHIKLITGNEIHIKLIKEAINV